MTTKVYVVTDLGPGDGGKGSVVHKVATMTRAHTIIKRGGAQGSHGVHTSKGQQFAFSQWGCGTLEGIPTHISAQLVTSPEGLLNEAEALKYQHGIFNPFDLLTVDEAALCATPYDGIASRIKEMSRGDEPRGTIGTGVGEAYRAYRRQPDEAIMVRDLTSPGLRDQLAATRQRVQTDLQYLIEYEFLPEDRATLAEEVGLLYSDDFFEYVVARFQEVGERARIVSSDFLGEVILKQEGVAVVETSHGVLTDRVMGFHPHTSAIRTLPSFTHGMLDSAGFTDEIVNIGVTRAYAIRHGAGPMPTANPNETERLLPGSNKDDNRYQGKVRVGALDTVLLRYALAACGGPAAFDGLAITWFDQIQTQQAWQICHSYSNADDPLMFSPQGDIKVVDSPSLEHQAALAHKLTNCHAEISTIPIEATATKDELFDVCADVFEEQVGPSVRMVSFGPTEIDKLCK